MKMDGMKVKASVDTKEILKNLDQNAATGLDMSPGDEVSALAAEKIRELEKENAKLKSGHTPGSRDDVATQAAAEMGKKGRDGAYLELEMNNLISAVNDGSMERAKMITLKGHRMELSDAKQIKAFMGVAKFWISHQKHTGLNDEQASASAIREIFVRGLLSFEKEHKGVA
jgi:hypothetical protein